VAKYTPYHPVIFRIVASVIVIAPIVGTAVAIGLLWQRAVHWPDLALFAIMYSLVMLGVTVGFHRMLSHCSFRPHPLVKATLLVLGSMAGQGGALEWAATHRKHHRRADGVGDPHSPVEGLAHAHIGWLFKNGMANPNIYCRHLLQDRMVVFISYTFAVWVVLGLLVPFLIAGWTGLLWGGLVRMFLVNHVIWSVNSIGHAFGRRDFETRDESHNVLFLGLLGFGEGWHNNHHAFPRSAFHGLRRWQLDLSGCFISILERLGLARDVCRVSPAMLARYSSGSVSVDAAARLLVPSRR